MAKAKGKEKADPQPVEAPAPPPGDAGAKVYRNRNKGIRSVPASSLKIHPKNWRMHPEYQQKSLENIFDRVGFVGTLVARELPNGDLELLDGHLRQDVLGSQPVEVAVTDLNDEEADLILATHDAVTLLANPNADKLRELLGGLQQAGHALSEMGWPEYKLDQFLPKDVTYAPVLAPTTSTDPVNPEDVAEAEQALNDRFAVEQQLVEVLCPHCAQKFGVRPDDLTPPK